MYKIVCCVFLALLLTACGEEQKPTAPATSTAPKPVEQPAKKVAETAEVVKEKTQQAAQTVAEKADSMKAEAAKIVDKAETKVAALAGMQETGQKVYQTACRACHDSGLMGAPKLGDERLKGDVETLVKHSINGIGRMPAKGGNSSLTDAEVRAAVEHMVEKSR